uniref:Uncharacterized protein n=1 Tax=Anguilla anguilla TaxID=7936 RepID=A0A0E9U5V7_ANGAN
MALEVQELLVFNLPYLGVRSVTMTNQ